MLLVFTKVKLNEPRLLRAVDRPDFWRFQPDGVYFEGDRSCHARIIPSLPKPHRRSFVRHGVLQAQTDEPPPTQPVADQFLTLRIGQTVAVLDQTHLEEHQRRTGRTPGRRWKRGLQRLFNWPPIQGSVQLFQKVIGRRSDHQVVQQSHLVVSRRLHFPLTHRQIRRSKELYRDHRIFDLVIVQSDDGSNARHFLQLKSPMSFGFK
jgi:hypothetical protein